jgi:hypothetical protein
MSDDRKSKRTWREIDRNKDRSDHRSEPGSGQKRGPKGQAAASRSHRSALDQLFNSGKVGDLVKKRDLETGVTADDPDAPSRRKLTEQINQAPDRETKVAAMDAYLEKFSLPADFDVLSQLLDHPDPDVVGETLDKIEAMLKLEKPRRARTLIAQLKTLQDLSEWGKLRRRAAALLDKL